MKTAAKYWEATYLSIKKKKMLIMTGSTREEAFVELNKSITEHFPRLRCGWVQFRKVEDK